jgi:hypothetical protein
LTTDTIDKQRMASEYGFALAFMNSDPELAHLFNQAVKNTWDVNMFTAKLRATKWFQHHSASVRNAIIMKTSDPASYKANVDQMISQVRDVWGKAYGAGTQPAQLDKWAETAFRMGWSQEQLMDRLGKGVSYSAMLKNKNLGGTAAETKAQLNEFISQYGIDPGGNWKAVQLKNVMTGGDTINGIQSRVRDMAKQQYGAFADQIDAGRTVMEIADPYMQKMSDLLELDPASVNVKDAAIQKALTMKNADGKPVGQSLSDFADSVRQDARWQYTKNAKQQVADVGSQLLRSFGLTA